MKRLWVWCKRRWFISACVVISMAAVIFLTINSLWPRDPYTQMQEKIAEGVHDVADLRFSAISSSDRQEIIAALSDKVVPLDVTSVISSTEGRLRDGRRLRLAYITESPSPQERERAQALLKQLLVDSNFVPFAIKAAGDDPKSGSIKEVTSESVTAIVAVHTGKLVVSDVGMLLLSNKLAAVDLQSAYAEEPLYRMEEEYLRTGKSP